ncbi:MAG: hypothetical protein AAFN51_02890, partial [Pseudomonadota bacterium]
KDLHLSFNLLQKTPPPGLIGPVHVIERKMRYLALYDMNRADEARRGRFLKQVETEMEVF